MSLTLANFADRAQYSNMPSEHMQCFCNIFRGFYAKHNYNYGA